MFWLIAVSSKLETSVSAVRCIFNAVRPSSEVNFFFLIKKPPGGLMLYSFTNDRKNK